MNYEQKMNLLANLKPEKKDMILARILKGERHVDITGDEDLFYQVNKDRVSLDEFTERDKYKLAAEDMKIAKQTILDTQHGVSKGKKMRWLGDIPSEIFFSRKEFQTGDKKEREKNIRNWLNKFSTFRAGDKQV